MTYIDYYQTLGISKNATQDEIKKAFKKLARKYHPDLNPNDTSAKQKFQEINEAHEVLSDPEKRKKYDTYGAQWKQADQFKSQNQSYSYQENDFSDFFESLFGSNRNYKNVKRGFRGEDYKTELQLSFMEAASTHKQILEVNGKKIRITIRRGERTNNQTEWTGRAWYQRRYLWRPFHHVYCKPRSSFPKRWLRSLHGSKT